MKKNLKLNHLILGLSLTSLSGGLIAQTVNPLPLGTINIYDAGLVPQILNMTDFGKGQLVMVDGVVQKKKRKNELVRLPKTAQVTHDNIKMTRDYYHGVHQRRSWDGRGATIEASINLNKFTVVDLLGMQQNAAWNGKRFIFGAGNLVGLDDFEKALDVVAHEYTHAVINTSSNLAYQGQSGALNEHLADVFGVIVNNKAKPGLKNPYLIGESIMGLVQKSEGHYALRDMMDPSKGMVPQPGHMSDLDTVEKFKKYKNCTTPSAENDQCGVHILSGIPNKAAALMFSALGMDKLAPMFYNVMTKRLRSTSNFSDYRKALLAECQVLLKSDRDCSVVDSALNQVGITD